MLLFVNEYTLIVEILPECDENPERTGRSGPPFLAPAKKEKQVILVMHQKFTLCFVYD